jgi:hypothetical protein
LTSSGRVNPHESGRSIVAARVVPFLWIGEDCNREQGR